MRLAHGKLSSYVNYDEMVTRSNSNLVAVRAAIRSAGLDGFVVTRADEHLGEYVPPGAERLAWLTGFTGSAGLAIVLLDRAAAFTDGRYTLQLEAETDPAAFERHHIVDDPAPAWLAAHAAPGARIGYDPRLMSADGLARYSDAGLEMVPVAQNLVDVAWTDRPPAPVAAAVPHELALSGVASAEKRTELAAALTEAGHDAAVITDPAGIAWLLNIRGNDLAYTPVALGFAILHRDATVQLFMNPAKVGPETRAWLGNGVSVNPPEALEPALTALTGQTVRVDRATAPVWFAQRLRTAGATVADAPDPCALPKACKNAVEQAGARAAHLRDAVAVVRFLHWLDTGRSAASTEQDAADRLHAFRAEIAEFREESFPTISGAGPNGAVIHYRVAAATNRRLGDNEVYLVDSGAQYRDGTTDVTRTIWTGPGAAPPELRERFTRVLQGHIAIASAVFPEGVAGPHLDALARRALWQAGLDYDHGTGHGVGSYLSVHEGPASLSRHARPVPLATGMILSNEPGYYEPGRYGIRLENLLLVQPYRRATRKPFLEFETLTWAPFDRRLIEPSLLNGVERLWLDGYHAAVLAKVGPGLAPAERSWLVQACRELPAG